MVLERIGSARSVDGDKTVVATVTAEIAGTLSQPLSSGLSVTKEQNETPPESMEENPVPVVEGEEPVGKPQNNLVDQRNDGWTPAEDNYLEDVAFPTNPLQEDCEVGPEPENINSAMQEDYPINGGEIAGFYAQPEETPVATLVTDEEEPEELNNDSGSGAKGIITVEAQEMLEGPNDERDQKRASQITVLTGIVGFLFLALVVVVVVVVVTGNANEGSNSLDANSLGNSPPSYPPANAPTPTISTAPPTASISPSEAPTVDYRPSNDGCTGAGFFGILFYNETFRMTGDTTNATAENSAVPDAPNSPGIWYSVTVGESEGFLVVDTCILPNSFDTVIRIYTGDCDNLELVGQNDDSQQCTLGQSRVSVEVDAPNVTYFALVHGVNEQSRGLFDLSVTLSTTDLDLTKRTPTRAPTEQPTQAPTEQPTTTMAPTNFPVPPNDECNSAVPFGPLHHFNSSSIYQSTLGATPEFLPSPLGLTVSPGVWIQAMFAEDAVVTASTCSSLTTMDTAIYIFSGSCGNLNLVGQFNNTIGCDPSADAFQFVPTGDENLILVHGISDEDRGDFELLLELNPILPSVPCSAIDLIGSPNITIDVSTADFVLEPVNSTEFPFENTCGSAFTRSAGVLYRFIPNFDGEFRVFLCSSIGVNAPWISFYRGSCGGGISCRGGSGAVPAFDTCGTGSGSFGYDVVSCKQHFFFIYNGGIDSLVNFTLFTSASPSGGTLVASTDVCTPL